VKTEDLQPVDIAFLTEAREGITAYLAAFEKVQIKAALKLAMEWSKLCNRYIQANQPWEKKHKSSGRSVVIIGIVV